MKVLYIIASVLFMPVLAAGAETSIPIELLGVLQQPKAVFVGLSSPQDHDARWLSYGQVFHGYTVINYDSGRSAVVLRKEGHDYTIPMKDAKIEPDAGIQPVLTATIELDESGKLYFEGKEQNDTSMAKLLADIVAKNKDTRILISAYEHTPVDRVSTAMDLCRKAGITKLLIQGK